MCKSCQWLEVSKYVFPDKTKSVVCSKCNKFLGFIKSNAASIDIKMPDFCNYKVELDK